jgi:hypothetical protein
VKEAPENSKLRLAYMELANTAYQLETPQIKAAMAEENQMMHLSNINEAHQMGHEMGNRPFEPAHNPFERHPHLAPKQPEGEETNQPKPPAPAKKHPYTTHKGRRH